MFCPHPGLPPRHEAKHESQDPRRDGGAEQQERLEDLVGGGRIRCPKCGWRPRKLDRWGCRCGCSWNTFDTSGQCPDCGRRWRNTQCLRCQQWSPHEDWYTDKPSTGT